MYRPVPRQLAFIKAEGGNRKGRGFQEGIAGKELLQMAERRVVQPGQSEVRGIFLFFSRDSDFREFLFHGHAEGEKVAKRLHSGPENPRGAAWRKGADALQTRHAAVCQ